MFQSNLSLCGKLNKSVPSDVQGHVSNAQEQDETWRSPGCCQIVTVPQIEENQSLTWNWKKHQQTNSIKANIGWLTYIIIYMKNISPTINYYELNKNIYNNHLLEGNVSAKEPNKSCGTFKLISQPLSWKGTSHPNIQTHDNMASSQNI